MITPHKLLPIFVSPIFLCILVALLAFLTRRLALGTLALPTLWALSLPVTSDILWRALEQHAVRLSVDGVAPAQVIVALSGMARTVRSEQGLINEWADASDRFWAGLELYKAGKAPRLFFTGGKLPWEKTTQTEGDWLFEQALKQGVPRSAMAVTSDVQNTADKARAIAAHALEDSSSAIREWLGRLYYWVHSAS
jgi:uncharacterized SAM-binding protein YcdF (DUF218 family)